MKTCNTCAHYDVLNLRIQKNRFAQLLPQLRGADERR
jgi:hypothetical protein